MQNNTIHIHTMKFQCQPKGPKHDIGLQNVIINATDGLPSILRWLASFRSS